MKSIKVVVAVGLFAGALASPRSSVWADDHDKLHVPPGHLPPAGKCRIWYPGTPPGHQPPPGDCRVLSRQLPNGAWLVSRDRIWRYEERPHYYFNGPDASYRRPDRRDEDHYQRGAYDWRRSHDRDEVKGDLNDVRAAHKNVQENRQQLENSYNELKKDRAELRNDIHNGASRQEIRQDRQEIRDDGQKITAQKQQVRQSEHKLDAARQELHDDLHRR